MLTIALGIEKFLFIKQKIVIVVYEMKTWIITNVCVNWRRVGANHTYSMSRNCFDQKIYLYIYYLVYSNETKTCNFYKNP